MGPDVTSSPFLHLYDTFVVNQSLVIVTDLIEGEELDIFCGKFVCGVPERIAKIIFKNVLKAVEHLHNEGFCHLDLKLENMIVNTKDYSVKLLDFGFARKTTRNNKPTYHKH